MSPHEDRPPHDPLPSHLPIAGRIAELAELAYKAAANGDVATAETLVSSAHWNPAMLDLALDVARSLAPRHDSEHTTIALASLAEATELARRRVY